MSNPKKSKDEFTELTRIDPRYSTRTLIEPDDEAGHRAMYISPSGLRDECEKWFLRGFACSGNKFHGESRVVNAAAFKRLMRIEFRRLWNDRNR